MSASPHAPPCTCGRSGAQALLDAVAETLAPPPALDPWRRQDLLARRADHVAAVLAMSGEVGADALLDGVRQAPVFFPVDYREATL
ncbi:hypothetical protein J0910_27585 [Nocardiopsis sp. CNT-189]|uniref:hypothetical protein n=1 Tax=Nocardiopsis oceanisediminis TaxID=2816862 RepID=UPI003B370186